ncbi:hypothetical protein GQ457_12G007350 [Hibiscus cannabinus]
MDPPPSPSNPAAPTNRPSLSWPQPRATPLMLPELPNDSVSAFPATASGNIKRSTLRRLASNRTVSGGSGWVKNRVGLLVTVCTGLTLDPVNITPGIENHVELFRRATDSDPGEILSTPLTCPGNNRGRKRLSLDLEEFGSERVDSGRVTLESGQYKTLVVGVLGFVYGSPRVKWNRENRRGGRVEEKGLYRLWIKGNNMLSLSKRRSDIEGSRGGRRREASENGSKEKREEEKEMD